MVLTGGACNLPGLTELGAEVTRLPVRVGMPPAMYGVSEKLSGSVLCHRLGLVMWKAKSRMETPASPGAAPSEAAEYSVCLRKNKNRISK